MHFRIQLALAALTLFAGVTLSPLARAGLPPTKSNLCLAMFRQVKFTAGPITPAEQRLYTLNSFKAFRENALRADPKPSIAEGLITSRGSTRGFGTKAAASRIAGIEDFARTTETETAGELRFMQTLTIVGQTDIAIFLREYRRNLELAEQIFFKDAVKEYKASAIMNTAFLSLIHYDTIANLDTPTQALAVAGIGAMQLIWKQDFIWKRPLYWDYSFLRRLKAAEVAIRKGEQRWALLSANFKINPTASKQLRRTTDEDVYNKMVRAQGYGEAPPLRDHSEFYMYPKSKWILEKAWVGVDLFFDHTGAEPELHVVIRGTEKVPPYPRTASEKDKAKSAKETSESLVPGTVPGITP